MKFFAVIKLCFLSLTIFSCFSAIGLLINQFSPYGIPLQYIPPAEIEIGGIKVPLLDEKQAYNYLNEQGYIFVDTRHREHYNEAHVPGAIFLPPEDIQDRFIEVQPFLMENDTLVLYCYGPDCDMAEKVAAFLTQMGYRHFRIMVSGFSGWKSAGFPTETSRR